MFISANVCISPYWLNAFLCTLQRLCLHWRPLLFFPCCCRCFCFVGTLHRWSLTSGLQPGFKILVGEACATRLCSHTFSVGLILEPREGWIVTSSMLTSRQTNRQRKLFLPSAWKSLVSVACLVFPCSLLWPTLLTCSGRASVTTTWVKIHFLGGKDFCFYYSFWLKQIFLDTTKFGGTQHLNAPRGYRPASRSLQTASLPAVYRQCLPAAVSIVQWHLDHADRRESYSPNAVQLGWCRKHNRCTAWSAVSYKLLQSKHCLLGCSQVDC